jgi:Mg-chelatase subunit ChlD
MLERSLTAILAIVVVISATPSPALTRLLAMRVEMVPVGPLVTDTMMSVVVQVAPEDRAEVGREALVRVELRRRNDIVDRAARTVTVDSDGRCAIDVAWPPGRYDLRVDLEAVTGGARGFWQGPVNVPRLEADDRDGTSVDVSTATEAPVTTMGSTSAPPSSSTAAMASEVAGDDAEAPSGVTPPAAPETVAASDVEGWSPPESGERDITVTVLEQARAVTGLTASSLRVEIGGQPAQIRGFGDVSEAPLQLALVVDLSPSMASHLAEVRRQLSRMTVDASGGRGQTALFVAAAGSEPRLEWGAEPGAVVEALANTEGPADTDLAGLVMAAIRSFEGRGGRSAVVIVTDGGDTADRGSWKDAVAVAETSPGPVLVVAFRGDGLDGGILRSLRRVAEVSGGELWALRDTDLLASVMDTYRDRLNASYAVRIAAPAQPERLRIEAVGGGWELHHPDKIR